MNHEHHLSAGAEQIDITPPPGTHLAGSGMGERRPALSVLDSLYARALVLESGGRRVAILSLDVTIITEDYTQKIRSEVARRTGITAEAIMVHPTQTHSAPSMGHFMLDPDFPLETTEETEYLRGGERAYGDFAAEAAIHAAEMAVADLGPARVGAGRGILGDMAFNRRGIRRDGRIMMPKPRGREHQPLGITDLCYLEGPMDPEVGVVCFQRGDGRPVALLLHYTCHPVNVFGEKDTYYAVSSDWPGVWASSARATMGVEAVPLVINGCCGNINPWHPFDPECRPDHRRMGNALAEMTGRIMERMTFEEKSALDWRVSHVDIPFRDIPDGRRRAVDEILGRHSAPPRGENGQVDPTWFLAASTRSVDICRRREGSFRYEIQVFRIGDIALIGLPGEPFVEGQLQLKTASPASQVIVAHLISHYVGYLPTREAYERGGHEANAEVTYWAKLAPGCLETVIDRASRMVEELWSV